MSLIPNSLLRSQWLDAMARIEFGTLTFVEPNGNVIVTKGKQPGPQARFEIKEWAVISRIIARGDIALGEDYIAGAWETDDIEALFKLFLMNLDQLEGFAHGNFLNRLGFVLHNSLIRRNSKSGSARNIKAHYDVGNDFYKLWLDETMTYSSALYDQQPNTLACAQRRKYGRILEKFQAPSESVLEIGCGWGGFAESALDAGHEVTGLTISPSQHKFATERLGGKADIRLQDYRDSKGLFDMIVSIEMIEAVGERYWPRYFNTVSERLRRGGRAVIQSIVVRDEIFSGYRTRSDFIRHYVFPGGMLPSVARIKGEAERAGLRLRETFSFGPDYARTLREWSERMMARKGEIEAMGYDQRFMRNWQFYLGICAAAFAVGRTDVVQLELAHA